MAREYTVPMSNVTVTSLANAAAVFVNNGTVVSIEFLRAWLSQSGNATSAQQAVGIQSQVTAFPTLTSQTPQKIKANDPASQITGATTGAAGTAGVNASVIGAGAKTSLIPDNFNVLNGYLWVPTPLETIIWGTGLASGVGLYWVGAVAQTANWSAGMTFRELG
jgi:hypothetical protein